MTDFVFPVTSIDESATFAVDTIKFGDGYSQAIPSGINNALRTWSVSFTDVSAADSDAMVAFWVARFGSVPFTWRPQGSAADVLVRCATYSRPIQNRYLDGAFVYTLSATFQEVAA